jgi:hypothetical protein
MFWRHGQVVIGIGMASRPPVISQTAPRADALGLAGMDCDVGRIGRNGSRSDHRLDGQAGPGDAGPARPGSYSATALQRCPDTRSYRSHPVWRLRSSAGHAGWREAPRSGRRSSYRDTMQYSASLARNAAAIDQSSYSAHRRRRGGHPGPTRRKGSGRHPGHDRDRAQRLLRQTASSDRPNVSLSVFRAPSGRHAIDPPRESWRRRPSPRRLASRHSPSFGARCRNDRTGVHRTAPRPPHRGQALPDRRWRQSRAALPQVVDSSIPSTGDG